MRLLDPAHGGGHAEHAHKAAGGLLVGGRNRPPLVQSGPKTFDVVAVDVDPDVTVDRLLSALGGDRRTCAKSPYEVTEGVAGVAVIGRNPGRDE